MIGACTRPNHLPVPPYLVRLGLLRFRPASSEWNSARIASDDNDKRKKKEKKRKAALNLLLEAEEGKQHRNEMFLLGRLRLRGVGRMSDLLGSNTWNGRVSVRYNGFDISRRRPTQPFVPARYSAAPRSSAHSNFPCTLAQTEFFPRPRLTCFA
jgi:hypothetical protein